MKAWLIDPFAKSVTEVETDGSLASLYALMDCANIEAVRPRDPYGYVRSDTDMLLLDEDGKYRHGQKYFGCHLWPFDALAGKALWIGSDGEKFGDPGTSLDEVENSIDWLTPL